MACLLRGGRDTANVFVPGVADALQPRLFTRFERGARSVGMGLGLSIGQAIAKAHGGTLSLQPSQERGAWFRLALPVPPQPTVPRDPEAGGAMP